MQTTLKHFSNAEVKCFDPPCTLSAEGVSCSAIARAKFEDKIQWRVIECARSKDLHSAGPPIVDSAPSSKKHWVLTQAAFNGLLAQLDTDRDSAGIKYENTRLRLVKFFERRSLPSPDDHADEVVNIVARQLAEGKMIENITAYFLAVAKRHVITILRGPDIDPLEDPEALPASTAGPRFEFSNDDDLREIQETRLKYLDHCLEQIDPQQRVLILGYYEEAKQAKIDNRKALAEHAGIDLNALRIRVCRIRMKLEKCIKECATREAASEIRVG